VLFTSGTDALNDLFGKDGTGLDHKGNTPLILLDRNLPDTTTPTLLYIDDNAGIARLVNRRLTRAGGRVVHAEGGQQGLASLAQGGIDAIALDQHMPGLDGL
jgi:PleD family two-component response regulator